MGWDHLGLHQPDIAEAVGLPNDWPVSRAVSSLVSLGILEYKASSRQERPGLISSAGGGLRPTTVGVHFVAALRPMRRAEQSMGETLERNVSAT